MTAKSPLGQMIERGYGGSRVNLDQLMAEIQAQAGSGRKAAKLVGVGESTWRRWRGGLTKPKPENLNKVGSAVRSVRASGKPLTAEGLSLKTRDNHDGRPRTIKGHQLSFTPTDISSIESAYIAGGGDAAARAFVAAIRDDFYHDYFDDLQYDGDAPDDDDYGGSVTAATW